MIEVGPLQGSEITVNDTYGHQAGDRVLVACAQYVMQHLRPYDKVFRYGGEEFVLTLQSASSEVALDADYSVEQSLDNADQALYAAKSAGRNRAHLWNSTVRPVGSTAP